MSKGNLKIVSLVLLLPLVILNASLAQPAKCGSGENRAPMPCCSTLTPVHKAVGANLSSAPCGCNMSAGPDVPPAAIATLVETISSTKNVDNYTLLFPKVQTAQESVRAPVAVSSRLSLSKSITSQKIYTLVSSFLI